MNQEIETTRPGRRGKEPGQPAGIVVRLPAWLNDKLCDYQLRLKTECNIRRSKEELILRIVNKWLIDNEQIQAEKGAGE